MGFLGLFKSKKEKFRIIVRACFNDEIKETTKLYRNKISEPLFHTMIIQSIESCYQLLINHPNLPYYTATSNFNPYMVIEEEKTKALEKYLKSVKLNG